MKNRGLTREHGPGGSIGSNSTRHYIIVAAGILFIGVCIFEFIYIPLFGVHDDGVPVPRWQMRPADFFFHMVHSVSPALVQPLQAIFFWYVGFGLYFGFRSISKNTVLDEPTRVRIFQAIRKEPGIHYNALRRLTGINRGTLRYHLTVLTFTKKIVSIRDGIFSRYLLIGLDVCKTDKTVACRFQCRPDRAILSYLLTHPNAPQHEIGSAAGISPSTLSSRIGRLQREGIVSTLRKGRITRINLTPEADESIQRIRGIG